MKFHYEAKSKGKINYVGRVHGALENNGRKKRVPHISSCPHPRKFIFSESGSLQNYLQNVLENILQSFSNVCGFQIQI